MKRLRLGSNNPETFFEIFAGKLLLLENLDFSFLGERHVNNNRSYFVVPTSFTACAAFIASLRNLKVLVVRCEWNLKCTACELYIDLTSTFLGDILDYSKQFWPTLSKTHDQKLQRLVI